MADTKDRLALIVGAGSGSGAILFTGASAGIKGYPRSAPFAMGKFALRGLAQSMARELAPKGVHVAHFVIDGGIRSAERPDDPQKPDARLDPDAIAKSYLAVVDQPRSAWTWERSSSGPGSRLFEGEQEQDVGRHANA
jgi:NAD(P)-dependent dehydrogenase (short-subunit alcohol dehydrogenase family)